MEAVAFKRSFFLNRREREKEKVRGKEWQSMSGQWKHKSFYAHIHSLTWNQQRTKCWFNTLMIPIYVKMRTHITRSVVLIHFIFNALLFSISTSCKCTFMELFFSNLFSSFSNCVTRWLNLIQTFLHFNPNTKWKKKTYKKCWRIFKCKRYPFLKKKCWWNMIFIF